MDIRIKKPTATNPEVPGEVEYRLIAYHRCKTCNVPKNMPGDAPGKNGARCPDCDRGFVRQEVSFEEAIANTPLFQRMLEALANCAAADAGIVEILRKNGFLDPAAKA